MTKKVNKVLRWCNDRTAREKNKAMLSLGEGTHLMQKVLDSLEDDDLAQGAQDDNSFADGDENDHVDHEEGTGDNHDAIQSQDGSVAESEAAVHNPNTNMSDSNSGDPSKRSISKATTDIQSHSTSAIGDESLSDAAFGDGLTLQSIIVAGLPEQQLDYPRKCAKCPKMIPNKEAAATCQTCGSGIYCTGKCRHSHKLKHKKKCARLVADWEELQGLELNGEDDSFDHGAYRQLIDPQDYLHVAAPKDPRAVMLAMELGIDLDTLERQDDDLDVKYVSCFTRCKVND